MMEVKSSIELPNECFLVWNFQKNIPRVGQNFVFFFCNKMTGQSKLSELNKVDGVLIAI